jgi:hypothetical protein
MGPDFWRNVLELLMKNPDLIIALVIFLGAVALVIGGIASLFWYLRGVWDRGQLGALRTLVEIGEKQLTDANPRLTHAQQQLQAREATEAVAGTISVAMLSLQNATTSNTAAHNIVDTFTTWGHVRRER